MKTANVSVFPVKLQAGQRHNVLEILNRLGSGLGHLGHSLRAFAEGLWLKRHGYVYGERWEGRMVARDGSRGWRLRQRLSLSWPLEAVGFGEKPMV